MELKAKIQLNNKGDEAFIPVKQLKVSLKWTSSVDLDLMAFYKMKDGTIGGVFSERYPDGSLGDLNQAPYMKLSGDAGVGDVGGDNEEILTIAQLDNIEKIYILTLNYSDTINNKTTNFKKYDGGILIQDDKGESFSIPLDSDKEGTVALIAQIDNTAIAGAKLINDVDIMSLSEFVKKIPGAELLTK